MLVHRLRGAGELRRRCDFRGYGRRGTRLDATEHDLQSDSAVRAKGQGLRLPKRLAAIENEIVLGVF